MHQSKAILLINLGSPNSYQVKDVKSYLDEFLMDEKVIDIPYVFRRLLVKNIIVPFRSKKSAEKYRSIWTEQGSPLVYYTKELTQLLENESNIPTYFCMRYAQPTPDDVLKKIYEQHPQLSELIVVPLYPHFAMSSFETAATHVIAAYTKGKYPFQLKTCKSFYNHPAYIKALGNSIKKSLSELQYDKILFSYHGIPERHIRKSDPTHSHCLSNHTCCQDHSEAHGFCYRHQVFNTTQLVANYLGLDPSSYEVSFQSRLGQDKWLKPFTAEKLNDYPRQGIKNLAVVCPAFVSDCLETLEEINIEGRSSFKEAGGNEFHLVPCLNLNKEWVEALSSIINQQ